MLTTLAIVGVAKKIIDDKKKSKNESNESIQNQTKILLDKQSPNLVLNSESKNIPNLEMEKN